MSISQVERQSGQQTPSLIEDYKGIQEHLRSWEDAADFQTHAILQLTQGFLDQKPLPGSPYELGSTDLSTRFAPFRYRFLQSNGSNIDVEIDRDFHIAGRESATGRDIRELASTSLTIREDSGTTRIRYEPQALNGVDQMRDSHAALEHYPVGSEPTHLYDDDRDCYKVGEIVRGEEEQRRIVQEFSIASERVDVWNNAERVLAVLQEATFEGMIDPGTGEVMPLIITSKVASLE